MLKLKLQYFGSLMWKELTHQKRPWCWERLKAEEGDDREWDGWMHQWLSGHELSKLWEMVKNIQGSLVCCSPWGPKESDMTEWLNNNKSKQTVFLYSKKYLNIGFDHAICHHFGGSKNGYIPGLHIAYTFLLHYILADKKRSGREIYITKSMN